MADDRSWLKKSNPPKSAQEGKKFDGSSIDTRDKFGRSGISLINFAYVKGDDETVEGESSYNHKNQLPSPIHDNHFPYENPQVSISNNNILNETESDTKEIDKKIYKPNKDDVEKDESTHIQPDGGLRAWLVMNCSFLCNAIIFGTINTTGIIYKKLVESMEKDHQENPAASSSLIISLAIGLTFFMSLVSGILVDRFGIRIVAIAGAILATLGMLLSSFFYANKNILLLTMGIFFGVGSSLVYTPSLAILGHYFRKRIGIVNGYVTAGSSVATFAFSSLLTLIIKGKNGLRDVFQLLAGLMAVLIICGMVFKPILPTTKLEAKLGAELPLKARIKSILKKYINFDIWKNKQFVIWVLAFSVMSFGYFVPYVHLIAHASTVLSTNYTSVGHNNSSMEVVHAEMNDTSMQNSTSDLPEEETATHSEVLVQCIAITSFIGRLISGFIADRPGVNKIFFQQLAFFVNGAMTMLLTVATNLPSLITITLIMGFADGCFISLIGPVAFHIVGPEGSSQGIGALFAVLSIGMTLGPFFAGLMKDKLGNYVLAFLCAGAMSIVSSILMFAMKFAKKR